MAFFEVNNELCTKDNVCIKVCVAGIIKADKESAYPFVDEKHAKRCIACGHCVAFCPHNACSVDSLPRELYADVSASNAVSTEQAYQFLRTRRSVRNYRGGKLPDEKIKEILHVANNAPSAENHQPVSWIVINGREKIVKIGDFCCNITKEMAKERQNREEKIMLLAMARAYESGNDVFMRGAPALVIALTPKSYYWPEDGTIATTYLELSAHAANLGACWAGYVVQYARINEELCSLLGVPDDQYICGALMIGEPLYRKVRRMPPRNVQRIKWL